MKAHGLEGLVAKRSDSRYEPGQRSGAWQKMRVNQGQPFVIAGFTPSAKNFDAIVFGYYDSGDLIYAGRTRNGFTPSMRDQLFKRFHTLMTERCPFANLPEARSGRWGEGLTAEKMKQCRWLVPELVGQFEFVEWTPDRPLASLAVYGPAGGPETGRGGEESLGRPGRTKGELWYSFRVKQCRVSFRDSDRY